MTWTQVLVCMVIGLAGGSLGGMLGIGGSLIMIPAMALLFRDKYGDEGQHLYQAAAMIVNLFVAGSALTRHLKAKAVRLDALKGLVPAAFITITLGVFLSNQFSGRRLGQVFAVFLAYVILMNIRRLFREIRQNLARASTFTGDPGPANPSGGETPEPAPAPQTASTHGNNDTNDEDAERPVTWWKGAFVGSAVGVVAGMLGIGGGAVAVPLQQVVFRIPLRQCIATSISVICIIAGLGAIWKNLTLAEHGIAADGTVLFDVRTSLKLAASLAPGAVVGGFLGGTLTHILPTTWTRGAFIVLLCFAAARMGGLF